MLEIPVRKGEPIDRALKRLKTKMESEGVLDEMRRLRSHETMKEKRKRKAKATAKRGKIRWRFQSNKPAVPAEGEAATAAPAAASAQ